MIYIYIYIYTHIYIYKVYTVYVCRPPLAFSVVGALHLVPTLAGCRSSSSVAGPAQPSPASTLREDKGQCPLQDERINNNDTNNEIFKSKNRKIH